MHCTSALRVTLDMTKPPHQDEYLKAQIRIGNAKGPTTYKLKQPVFHHDDITDERRARRAEVRTWLRKDVLTVAAPSWQKSSHAGVPVCERRNMENYSQDRSNA